MDQEFKNQYSLTSAGYGYSRIVACCRYLKSNQKDFDLRNTHQKVIDKLYPFLWEAK